VAPSQIGSIEFAADQFGTRLVVVLGHSRCGAIAASMNLLLSDAEHASPNLDFIVSRIKPAIQNVVEATEGQSDEDRMQAAVRANIRASVEQLRHGSEILEGLIANDGLRIVGAEYDLETGGIEFLDE
jgi:carbonic anhydrase